MSQPSSPSLAVVPPEEYQQFADALNEFHPHSYQVSGGPVPHLYQIEDVLRGHLKYMHLDIVDAHLYAPADAVHRHHLAVISPVASATQIKSFSIYWNEHHLSDDDVYQLLKSLPFGSWKNPFMVRQIPLHLQPKMDGIMSKLSDGELHLFSPIPVMTMLLTPENTPPVPKLPDGYYFGILDGSYAEEILLPWIGAVTETINGISQFLDKFPSAAIFYRKHLNGTCEETASNGRQADELVSYSVYKHGADIGMTYTKESHRRKGLASAATIQLAHKMHRVGLPVTVIIDFDYKNSQKMHKGIGFTHYCDVAVPFYFPRTFDFDRLSYFSNFAIGFSGCMQKWNQTHVAK
ncbi:FR47-like [Trinorchestia longiramus]|nr:FR47-like [Trinorchestia longiramus]